MTKFDPSQLGLTPVKTPDPSAQASAPQAQSGAAFSPSNFGLTPVGNQGRATMPGGATAPAPAATGIGGLQQNLQSQADSSGYIKGLPAGTAAQQVAGAAKIAGSIKEGSNLMEQSQSLYEKAPKGIKGTGQRLKSDAKFLEGAGTAAFGGIAGAAQSIFAPITAAVSPIIKAEAPTLEKVVRTAYPNVAKLYDLLSPAVKTQIAPVISKLAAKHPDATTLAGDIINTGLLAVGGGEAEGPAKEAIGGALSPEGIQGAKDALKDIPANLKTAKNAAEDLADTAHSKLQQRIVQSEKNNWIKPVEKPIPAYNKATDIYNAAKSKGTNIEDILVNGGIKLSDNTGTNQAGKTVFDTADTAAKVRSDAQKVTTDVLRPALREADSYTPPVETKSFVQKAIQSIRSNSSIEREEKDALTEAIAGINFPKTMSLEDLLDEKITRDANSKYNALGDIGSTRKVQINKALGDAIRSTLEGAAPKDIPVAAINKEAGKLYDTANYLDALDTKPAPRSIMARAGATIAKAAGAAVGSVGGVFGEIAGYNFGGMLEGVFENMSDPIKTKFLDELEKTEPKAFSQVKKYLGDQETARLTRKALPAPAELGTAQNPRIANAPLGSSATFEPQAQSINTEPSPKPNQPLALPPGKAGAIDGPTIGLPPAGTYDKEALEKSGLNEVLNAKIKNPADRRRIIKILFPPK